MQERSYPFVTILDNNFLNDLIEQGVDKNGDGIINNDEAAEITFLEVCSSNISDFKGIEAFVNLDSLDCGDNSLTNLDLSNNHELLYLQCWRNLLTSLDVSNNPVLHYLYCLGIPPEVLIKSLFNETSLLTFKVR
jgi:hypothetical protein